MCRGHLVETARSEDLFKNPIHPYTRALLRAVPEPNPDRPLDFSGIMEDRASNPAEWPHPFAGEGAERPVMRWISDGHTVRALPDSDLEAWMS